MKAQRLFRWMIPLVALSLAGCRLLPGRAQIPTATPTLTPTLSPTLSPTDGWPPALAAAHTPTGDRKTGRVRGRLFYPSEQLPALAVYAVATDGSRFYRADTEPALPGEPSYEIPVVEPGAYYVYAYRAWNGDVIGGAYSYLAACEAGLFPQPTQDWWGERKHDLAPVEVTAGQAIQGINIYDWYGPSVPPPPDDTSGWQTYTDQQVDYHIRYPPHWEVRSQEQGETTFGLPLPAGEDLPEEALASVRVTNGDPEELADQLIGSLSSAEVVSREWLPFSGCTSLYLALELPEGRFAWWFVPRYELVYILHAVTDSGLGSFDQLLDTFAFVKD